MFTRAHHSRTFTQLSLTIDNLVFTLRCVYNRCSWFILFVPCTRLMKRGRKLVHEKIKKRKDVTCCVCVSLSLVALDVNFHAQQQHNCKVSKVQSCFQKDLALLKFILFCCGKVKINSSDVPKPDHDSTTAIFPFARMPSLKIALTFSLSLPLSLPLSLSLYLSLSWLVARCGPPQRPQNGDVSASSVTYASTATFSCNTGYRLTGGDAVHICQANGRWRGVPPRCESESLFQ